MPISATQVKQLRDMTGAGFMECKSALAEADGNLDKAVTVLRTRGQAKAARRAGRTTAQGLVGHYVHLGGQVGVLVEVNCESDFVARTDDFQTLVKEVAMHVAAANPTCVRRDEVAADDSGTGAGHRPRAVRRVQQAAAGHREDRRGQAQQLLRAGGPAGPAVDSGPEDDDRRDGQRGHRQAGREHHHRPLRALQGGRVGHVASELPVAGASLHPTGAASPAGSPLDRR